MSRWLIEGLRTHKPTTVYPGKLESARGVSPGLPKASSELTAQASEKMSSACPVDALSKNESGLDVCDERCIHCMKCKQDAQGVGWDTGYEWARFTKQGQKNLASLGSSFKKSLHIRHVDAGACGACLSEMALLAGPHYNLHRLGFFFTPTPRKADVLIVSGPVTDHMRDPLAHAYESMPETKRVMALGSCALTGGVFGPSFASTGSVADIIPVDVIVPGCPPPPLAILHALLLLTGRKAAAEKAHETRSFSTNRSPA